MRPYIFHRHWITQWPNTFWPPISRYVCMCTCMCLRMCMCASLGRDSALITNAWEGAWGVGVGLFHYKNWVGELCNTIYAIYNHISGNPNAFTNMHACAHAHQTVPRHIKQHDKLTSLLCVKSTGFLFVQQAYEGFLQRGIFIVCVCCMLHVIWSNESCIGIT